MKLEKKIRVGIWGFGTVGKSALSFFRQRDFFTQVYDTRALTESEIALITTAGATYAPQDALMAFLEHNDQILVSPGVDLRQHEQFKHKWLTELDLLQQEFHKPVVAITGSVGKTSVTHLLSQVLSASGLRVWTGGNIGTGMLDVVALAENVDVAVLEVSSFQLEHCKTFAPTVALWTNLSANHLDRHGTMESYCAAKKNIFAHQTTNQHAIVPLALQEQFLPHTGKNTLHFFAAQPAQEKPFDNKSSTFSFIKNNCVIRHGDNKNQPYSDSVQSLVHNLATLTYQENALIIALAADLITKLLGRQLNPNLHNATLPPHRLEHVATIDGISFYNDSKSTAPAPTIAAVQKFADKPILLLLGGFKKGVDRAPLIAAVKDKVKMIYAFGAERDDIASKADEQCAACKSFATLEEAFSACVLDAQTGDTVLLSPAGSSFDLFKNYEERGNRFKQLVTQTKK
jgi:UDP-N-acetylmuramoylalanine--D-glutamate ligase